MTSVITQINCFSTFNTHCVVTKFNDYNLLHIGVSVDALGQAAAKLLDLPDQAGAVQLMVYVADLDHAVLHPVLIVVVLILGPHLEVERLESGRGEELVVLLLVTGQRLPERLRTHAEDLLRRVLTK